MKNITKSIVVFCLTILFNTLYAMEQQSVFDKMKQSIDKKHPSDQWEVITDLSITLKSGSYWTRLNERFPMRARSTEQNQKWVVLAFWLNSLKKKITELICCTEDPNKPLVSAMLLGENNNYFWKKLRLHKAVIDQDEFLANLLLVLGANPNLSCNFYDDKPALFFAKSTNFANMLLAGNANVNARGQNNSWPLLCECAKDTAKPAALLSFYIEKGAKPEEETSAGNTALHILAARCHAYSYDHKLDEFMKKYQSLKEKINPNKLNKQSETVLDCALASLKKVGRNMELEQFIELMKQNVGAKTFRELQEETENIKM